MNLKTTLTKFSILLLLTAAAQLTKAQQQNYPLRIQAINQAINTFLADRQQQLYLETTDSVKKENPHSWLWPLCALLQAANEMEVLSPKSNYIQRVKTAIDQYYSEQPPVPAFQDYVSRERLSSRFYDDNEWLAIAYLDAYGRTHRKDYLQTSELIGRFLISGTDTVTGGGIYWKEGDKTTKNTCSNGPGIIVMLRLYQFTHQKIYLDKALEIYQWTNKNLQSPEGTFYDNIQTQTHKIGRALFTYNTGTMLESNVLFFQIFRDKKYLAEAQRIALAGRTHFFRNGRLPSGNYWFNAVMLRGYLALYHLDHYISWVDFFRKDADAVWNTERDQHNLVGLGASKKLIDQAAMIEIYARLQQVEGKQ